MADPILILRPGCQRWLIARTDRDGASADQIADWVAGFTQYSFRTISGDQPGSSPEELISTGEHQWRVSSARPVAITVLPHQDTPIGLNGATLIQGREQLDELPVLARETSKPWYLELEIWWRGPQATIAWPCLAVNAMGQRSHDYANADWLLMASWVPKAIPADPGEESWSEATEENVTEALEEAKEDVKKALSYGAIVAGVVAVALAGFYVASLARRH
jgi:hypothetical protein